MHRDRNAEIEADLDLQRKRRTVDAEDLRPLLQDNGIVVLDSAGNLLEGRWGRYGHDDTAECTLVRSNGGFSILFETCGDLAQWTLQRTGVFENGMLVLNRPVIEYCPRYYDRLYFVDTR